MNIVFLVYELINSGPENVLYDICSNLDRKKYNPIIVTLRDGVNERTIEPKFDELGIEIRHFSFSTLQVEFRTNWVAKRIEASLKELGDYVIHAHGHHPTLIASHFKHPSMCTIHCISGEDYVMKKGRLMGRYMSSRFKSNLGGLDCPVAISYYMRDYYKRCTNKDIITIYNGVSAEPSTEIKADLRKRLGVDDNKYVIVVIGALIPRKNPSYILEQLKKSKDNDFLCIFVGNGSDLQTCKQMTEGDNRFRFDGFKSNVGDYLNIANLCISASLSEGLPLSVLEAINVGVPMLMSDIPPHKEIEDAMKIESVKTFSLSKSDFLSAFEAMKACSFSLGELQQKAHVLFSARTMTEQYEKVYDSLMNNE